MQRLPWAGLDEVRANRAYELIVSRGGIEPAFLADPDRIDRVEVCSVDDREVVLYWELPPKRAARLLKALRADLVTLEAGEFIARWGGLDLGPDPIA
jgi:hypothetical protein